MMLRQMGGSRLAFNAVRAASLSTMPLARSALLSQGKLTGSGVALAPGHQILSRRWNSNPPRTGDVEVASNKIDPALGLEPIDFLFIVG